jgi:hypothetical protein
MNTFADLIFVAMVSWLLIHELDAIQQHEWRFFFSWMPISDKAAYWLFTAAHAPLLILILWNLQSRGFQIGLDIFMIIHLGLHIGLRNHPLVTFNNTFSRVWIYGGAALAVLHLILLYTG